MQNIKDTILLLNPWWEGETTSEELAKHYKRRFFAQIQEFRKYRQIIILTGLRRVGKTTLIYQTIKDLLSGTDPKRIFYFSFDKEIDDLVDLFENYKELTGVDYKKEKIFVFFDEITKFKKWARELKLIYDSSPNIKFCISSSSSINLEEEAIKNLAGRYFLINITPLSFKEFLELADKKRLVENPELHSREIKKEFFSYLLKSFPEIANWGNELVIKDYLKTTIIDKVIKSDLPERFDNINKELLYKLIELFYKEPGFYLNYDNLSKSLRISKNTLYQHIFYLEFCYLIRIVKNFKPSTLSTSRKLQRVYPYWWNLAYCYGGNNDKILESFVLSTIDGKYYWRELEKEIDFLKIEGENILPIEVKNREKVENRDLSALKLFMSKHKIKKSLLLYLGDKEIREFDGRKIEFASFWSWLLEKEVLRNKIA
ncbi:MAG TPA: ATP-binding protein [Candidatus Nanoarchaeia archaeon]|nr:ATP-binding protein [Candidatus Nanoarchaeia archaeon]